MNEWTSLPGVIDFLCGTEDGRNMQKYNYFFLSRGPYPWTVQSVNFTATPNTVAKIMSVSKHTEAHW